MLNAQDIEFIHHWDPDLLKLRVRSFYNGREYGLSASWDPDNIPTEEQIETTTDRLLKLCLLTHEKNNAKLPDKILSQ